MAYEVKDRGVALALSLALVSSAILEWGIARKADKYGGLAVYVVAGLIVGIVWVTWGWLAGLYTTRTAGIPILLNVIFATWIWSVRPRT